LSIAPAAALMFLSLTTGPACGQQMSGQEAPVKPRVYALLGAVGAQFNLVSEVQTTGSHLSPYRRKTIEALNDVLNRLALHGLDNAIEKLEPESKRIYLTLAFPTMHGVAPPQRETALMSEIQSALKEMPQRLEWDRIVVATPAYGALEKRGIAGKLQGFGLFIEPLCQGGCGTLPGVLLGEDGVEAMTSDDKIIRARTYIAPFSYIDVWVLDAKTLTVLDRQEGFDSQKLADPSYKPLDLSQSAAQNYLLGRVSSLVERSVGDAVTRSVIGSKRGKVEFGDIKEVEPNPQK